MIAHGTAIVPFVSILERIKNIVNTQNPKGPLGTIFLFFGGRND
jgi:hypothetical protein